MFYSQTFLARKGPLGTVWCAAHLQHRLKKSHYSSTDIPSTVDRIMFPEVPIALRMSGHLLLGVVRIYSKKVDYLFQDCNAVLNGLRKAFASIDLNLPEDARQAPVQSITLPYTFDLDTLDLDHDIYDEGSPDNHLKSREEITLADQIPIGRDPYVAISFDEDFMMMDSSRPEVFSDSDVRLMDGILPSPPVNGNDGFQHPDPSNQREEHNLRLSNDENPQSFPHDVESRDESPSNHTEMLDNDADIPQDLPEREILRDSVHGFGLENLPPIFPDCGDDLGGKNRSLDQTMNEKETFPPIMDENLLSVGQSLPFQQHSESPPSAASQPATEIFDAHVSLSVPMDISPGLGIIRSTPPVKQPKARKKKRKQFFDESTVLSNKLMKKSLEDSSDLLRKKRDAPCSTLGIWKLNNTLRKEQVFHQPSLTGLCLDLCDIFKDLISTKPHLIFSEETFPDPKIAASPASTNEAFLEPRDAQSPAVVPELDMEIERPRNIEAFDGGSFLPEFVPSQARFTPSPIRRCDFTPATTIETRVSTPHLAASTGTGGSEKRRRMTFSEEHLSLKNTGLSDIPGLMNSAEADDLYFLEEDNNTPTAGSQGTERIDSLSARTRAVAQYLKRHSPFSASSEGLSGDLILNKTLEGRTRKLCARMFYETLVLKSYGLVDVQQEEPFSDIRLKLTPTFSKTQI
ncbi:sister chromatid cohesion 1 protein 3-like isoform X1 [Juglans microcarpa x Juglans regia]|uniref:sister chromatid cohesion 1 protein 3-like isoform X1 n=1 Tax=Juglans microcarpa x Juglans regia TaxID=2249226 RepID=UPI001B7E2483|nr:sister chromatid cohesion 1 protein 3-like isoform X1 [Juglans microcarpa x Juglans regia]